MLSTITNKDTIQVLHNGTGAASVRCKGNASIVQSVANLSVTYVRQQARILMTQDSQENTHREGERENSQSH